VAPAVDSGLRPSSPFGGGSTWRSLGYCEGREVAPAVDSGLRPSSPFGGGSTTIFRQYQAMKSTLFCISSQRQGSKLLSVFSVGSVVVISVPGGIEFVLFYYHRAHREDIFSNLLVMKNKQDLMRVADFPFLF